MAYNDKESKNEVEDYRDCITFKNKTMRRWKPQQQIYRPGSGPLRKSVQEAEDNEYNVDANQAQIEYAALGSKLNRKRNENAPFRNNNSENVNTVNQTDIGLDAKKRSKKPEQPIYVPKPLAQAMAERGDSHSISSNEKSRSTSNLNKASSHETDYRNNSRKTDLRNGNMSHHNGSIERQNTSYSKSKRFSNSRNRIDHLDHGPDSDRHLSPVAERRYGNNRDRDTRQASEPRALVPPVNMNRVVRDTRSVEPAGNNQINHNYQAEKVQSKPPSGRRHSTICLESGKQHKSLQNLESLPPRFRRKYFADNNIDPSSYPGTVDDATAWDGTTVTFKKGPDNSHWHHPQSMTNLSYHHPNQAQTDTRSNYPIPSYMNNVTLSQQQQQQQQLQLHQQQQQQHHHQQQQHHHQQQQHHHQQQHQHQPEQSQQQPPAVWSYTIPNTRGRGRGRGRLRQDSTDSSIYGSQILRSLTPDRALLLSPANSRPCTPPPFAQKNKSVENINYIDNNEYQKLDRTPPLSPQKNNALLSPRKSSLSLDKDEPDDILDWSEEVELNEKLEAEALSDCMTRCSSVVSLNEPMPLQQTTHKSRKPKRGGKGNRNRSSSRHSKRDRSNDNQNNQNRNMNHEMDNNHNKQNNKRNNKTPSKELHQSREKLDSDGFKIPESRNNRRRKNSFRDRSNERRHDRRSNNDSRHSSLDRDRARRDSHNEIENWREEIRLRCSSEKKLDPAPSSMPNPEKKLVNIDKSKSPAPGIIILPQNPPVDRSKPPILPEVNRAPPRIKSNQPAQQRTLFDPNNPNKPIIVTSTNSRLGNLEPAQPEFNFEIPASVMCTDQFGNTGPSWYDPYTDNFRACHYPHHLMDVKRADFEMQHLIRSGALMANWNTGVAILRKFFRESLEYLLVKDIKFCQTENIENYYWKILYYNIIELMRKSIVSDPENKNQYKSVILSLIDEGTKYYERLLEILEDVYKFKLDNHLGIKNIPPSKGLRFVGLALVSAQKIFLFLGDLARYKEQVNETSNYGKCRQWYIKAHEINPKNGRPYNQLALLAVYARRKLDAVYYYMRSLMSSNPVQSAKESLISLFDENRKKYEQSERKRREEKAKLQMKEKESTQNVSGSLRREIWIHPDGGRRLHRTTSATQETVFDSEEEDLHALSSVEVNKRFITSYLHVHGKLITKIGMETFQQAALQMLREFRVLLQQSPVPLTSNRFLHLLALNMFAIDSTQLKGPELEPGCRSEVQERALVVSLQMFNVILERCVDLLQEHLRQQDRAPKSHTTSAGHNTILPLSQDLQVMLPAIKIWCDWMLCHSCVWNPPPSCADYKIGASGDTWGRLATIMNQLEKLEYQNPLLESSSTNDNDLVRLPEDATMCGFTPLMYNSQPTVYVRDLVDMESAQMTVRINRLLFFGTEFLCGLEPPVLKLQRYDTFSEYISVVRTSSRDSPPSPPELCNADLLLESFSEDEEDDVNIPSTLEGAPGEIRKLLNRKVELEKRQRTQELHRQRVQAILQQSVVSVEIEVRPRYLVPDTNCFIDYLERLQTLVRIHPQPYTLMVPLVVVGELEGLARGGKTPLPTPRLTLDPEHLLRVADAARQALDFLHQRTAAVKCITTRGTILASSTFTSEDDDRTQDVGPRNDDRILASCLSLCRGHGKETEGKKEVAKIGDGNEEKQQTEAQLSTEPRRIYREVVLLTEDRNLRVKALARDVPVRELSDFLQWAGLG